MPEIELADLVSEAQRILDSLGQARVSETAYDTAWVARVPHPSDLGEPLFPASLDWLITHQHADGWWGGAIAFPHDRLISTLAATVALAGSPFRRAESEPAVRRAVVYLNREHLSVRDDPAETVGFELLLPELVREAQQLGLQLPYQEWAFVEAIKADKLHRIPPIAVYGGPTPLTFSLEYLGAGVSPILVERCRSFNGSYGASPSATAYVHMQAPAEETEKYLREVTALSDTGGVMDVYPIDVFEIAWGLKSLLPLRDQLKGYDRPVRELVRFWSPAGVSYTASGMVANSDDTASALFVLHSVGERMDTDVLELFEGPEAFYCFPFERNRSVRANAAILEAIRLYDSTPSRRRMTLKLVHYLRESQIEGKYWLDKWHVSPFYATARAVAALGGLDNRVVRAAIEWILEEQHESGMWGVDDGTAEETAYALDSLLAARTGDPAVAPLVEAAIDRGHARLSEHAGDREHPPLWLGKGLYTPVYVVQAAVVGTLARLELTKAASNPGTVNVG